jgi:hypothetical protein
MSMILVASMRPRAGRADRQAGKTTIAAGLAQRLAGDGRAVWLCRLRGDDGEDPAAEEDASLFASISSVQSPGCALTLEEAEKQGREVSGSKAAAILESADSLATREVVQRLGASVVLCVRNPPLGLLEELASAKGSLGDALLGVVATAVPGADVQATVEALAARGIPCLAVLPEDRALASPTVGQITAALQAKTLLGNGNAGEVVEYPVIGPISADSGRPYFARWERKAVITRSDRTDIQLAALGTATACLILTGGEEPSPYLIDRASREGMTVLLAPDDTPSVVGRIEGLYESVRFTGERKLERIGELLAEHLDYDAISKRLG